MHLFLISEVIPGKRRDTLALRMHEPTPKCVLWILSSMAGLIKVGMTACCPLYTMPYAKDSSSTLLFHSSFPGCDRFLVFLFHLRDLCSLR